MSDKFERFSVSANPKIVKKIREAAEQQNIPISRFVSNAALREAQETKILTKAQLEALQRQIKPVVLRELEKALAKKILNGAHSAVDFQKWKEIKKRADDAEASHFFEADKPVTDADLMKAKGFQKIARLRRRKEEQEIQKVLEGD